MMGDESFPGVEFELDITRIRPNTAEVTIGTSLGELDLHNFASFDRVCFSADGIVSLIWREYQPGEFRVGQIPIERLTMSLTRVTNMEITPSDPEIPTSEDTQLSHFMVTHENGDRSLRVQFVLGNGRVIDVLGDRMRLTAARNVREHPTATNDATPQR